MNQILSISPFSLSPKYQKLLSSDVNGNQLDTFDLSEKEINSLKEKMKKYLYDYCLLISEIDFWKKILDKKITSFKMNIQSFIDNDIKFVDNFTYKNAEFDDVIKFKKIYSNSFTNQANGNDKVYNLFLNEHSFSISKDILNLLIDSNSDINNISKFVYCSSKVLEYIIEFNKKYKNIKFSEKCVENKSSIKMNNISSFSIEIKNEDTKTNYPNKKIIEKYIDFKESNNINQRNKNLSLSIKSQCNVTPKNNLKKFRNNFESLKTSQSSNNIWYTPKVSYQKNIYLRKSVTPLISEGFCKNFQIENTNAKDESINLILNKTKIIEGNKYLNKNSSMNNIILNNNNWKFLDVSSSRNKNSKTNCENSLDLSHKINLDKRILNLKKNSVLNRKEKEQKTYVHKKMLITNNLSNNLQKNIERLNMKRHIRSNSNLIPSANDKILDFKNMYVFDNSFLNNKSKNILNNISKNNEIKSSLFKTKNLQNKIQNTTKNETKICDKVMNNPFITKIKNDEKIMIDTNYPLYLGLDLGDANCKLSLINHPNNEIKLISFKKDLYSIPSIIYFNSKKEEIKIGYEAENQGIKESSQIIFNLLKYIGIKYNEIVGLKELLPFKINKNEQNNRPYVEIDFNGLKNKLFYFEDLLSLFLQKIFQQFFDRIITNKNNNKTINLFIDLSLPNYLSYLQKKIIEKIFYNQLFYPNIKYNNYIINLMNINLENSPSIACLYSLTKKGNYTKDGNILIINTDRCSINLTIVNENIDKKIYEVKSVESAAFGEEDLIDTYLLYCIRNLENKYNIDFTNTPSILHQLRKKISSSKNNFDIIPKAHVSLDTKNSFVAKYVNNIDIILTKDDYERSCDEFFKKIIMLIKTIIDKSSSSIQNIDDIISIGQISKSIKMKTILINIFRENEKIIDKLVSYPGNKELDTEYSIVIGCALQAMNNNLLNKHYSFIDICPSSFGVESINGIMEIIIQKGNKLPCKNKKLVKVNNKNDNICINIYEGEDKYIKNNKYIISANIDKSNFTKCNIKDFVEVYIQLEIDNNNNLKCFISEPNSKNIFECLININVVKN